MSLAARPGGACLHRAAPCRGCDAARGGPVRFATDAVPVPTRVGAPRAAARERCCLGTAQRAPRVVVAAAQKQSPVGDGRREGEPPIRIKKEKWGQSRGGAATGGRKRRQPRPRTAPPPREGEGPARASAQERAVPEAEQTEEYFRKKWDTSVPVEWPSEGDGAGQQRGWLWQALDAADTKGELNLEGLRAKKSLGQNFLTDATVLEEIVAAAGVVEGDLVLEVGPGTGNLTRRLLDAGARVLCVEKDTRLFERLVKDAPADAADRIRAINVDVLKVDIPGMVEAMQDEAFWSGDEVDAADRLRRRKVNTQYWAQADASRGAPGVRRRVRVVANLPYNITTDFMKRCLPMGDHLADLCVMLQHEVAERLTSSRPGDADYRAVNIQALLFSRPKYLLWVSRKSFFPAPNVDSALARFELRRPGELPRLPSVERFLVVVNAAFSSRRKMIKNNLKALYSVEAAEDALEQAGLPTTARAQDLSVKDFILLVRALEGDQ
ncbi:unnamed protein product [Pedinophyceae sp. YPF-701]|nr:unnamed protein product [Pedinophyceae sp. YPF-701]